LAASPKDKHSTLILNYVANLGLGLVVAKYKPNKIKKLWQQEQL
jgi:hypothetical protein|tara:strand:+ start:566 stop:697 length:132 start_codon:yes stop_codon:yes gene_type:complete